MLLIDITSFLICSKRDVVMIVSIFEWTGKKWESAVAFTQTIKPNNFHAKVPSKSRRKLYVSKHVRLVHIRFPWNTPVPGNPMAEVTFTESEIFRLAKFARRNRTDEQLLEAILKA